MRQDFAKLLVERERHRHADKHHNYRHMKGPKGLNDDEVGGRESMKFKYNFGYDRKSFNENLNPLKGWVRSCIGKNWDKCYGELRSNFDARSVVNQHILEHLWDYVEIQTFIGEKGAVMFMDTQRYTSRGAQPISKCYKDFYVCPKSGCLKVTQKQPRRSILKEKEANKLKAELAVKRRLNEREVLHLIDGVWYHFDLLPVPKVTITYERPASATPTTIFKVGYNQKEKTWDELNEGERQQHGTARFVGKTARDELTNEVVYKTPDRKVHWTRYRPPVSSGLYHANKKTANKKQLKQAGITC